ncbi:hypothetical protein PR048_008625 [Dryococelus australis]|uniref:Uncharacterized protein n=1 Tax=Dryococelus australis TaxID=614101 RepID=A0ABQ9HYG2_9NEOP|nr:hypothetical protein PR048_008625 [Dryococelus australis]
MLNGVAVAQWIEKYKVGLQSLQCAEATDRLRYMKTYQIPHRRYAQSLAQLNAGTNASSVESNRAVAERLACSPPTKTNRVQSPAGPLPEFCMWESCRTMLLVGGFSRESPVPPPLHSDAAPYSRRFTLIGSQNLAVKSRLNYFTLHSTLKTDFRFTYGKFLTSSHLISASADRDLCNSCTTSGVIVACRGVVQARITQLVFCSLSSPARVTPVFATAFAARTAECFTHCWRSVIDCTGALKQITSDSKNVTFNHLLASCGSSSVITVSEFLIILDKYRGTVTAILFVITSTASQLDVSFQDGTARQYINTRCSTRRVGVGTLHVGKGTRDVQYAGPVGLQSQDWREKAGIIGSGCPTPGQKCLFTLENGCGEVVTLGAVAAILVLFALGSAPVYNVTGECCRLSTERQLKAVHGKVSTF